MPGEKKFKLFFVCVDKKDIKIMKDMDWHDYMISVIYWDRVEPGLHMLTPDDMIMLDNGYITKFAKRLANKETIPLEEKIEHSEFVIKKYQHIAELLKPKNIRFFVFDFDFFLEEDEYEYRRKYLKKLVELFGKDNVFVVFHENDLEHIRWARDELGITKVAISSALGSKIPVDFHAEGFEWVHYFGTFSNEVYQAAIFGKVDSADISSWASVQRFGIIRKFENGSWLEEEIGADIKLDKEKYIKMQIEEYKKALQYLDDVMNMEFHPDINHIRCDTCPLKDRCPHYKEGGICFVEESDEAKLKNDIVDEFIWLAQNLKKKMLYESLKAQATGLTATKLEMSLLRLYIQLLEKSESFRLKRLELSSAPTEFKDKKEEIEELKRLIQMIE